MDATNAPEQPLDDRIDFRFEIRANPEPSCNADLSFITQIATFDGEDVGVIDSWTCEDPFAAVEAAREAQTMTLEERWDYYAQIGL